MSDEVYAKIKAALTESEFLEFSQNLTEMYRAAMEMRTLLNDKINRETLGEFTAMTGITPEFKVMDELEWEERANAVLDGADDPSR